MTFRSHVVEPVAERKWSSWTWRLNTELYGRRFAKRRVGCGWARATEWQKNGRLHFHALMTFPEGDVADVRRVEWAKAWEGIGGRSKILKPRAAEVVADYCAKYTTKGGMIDLGGFLQGTGNLSGISPRVPPSGLKRPPEAISDDVAAAVGNDGARATQPAQGPPRLRASLDDLAALREHRAARRAPERFLGH